MLFAGYLRIFMQIVKIKIMKLWLASKKLMESEENYMESGIGLFPAFYLKVILFYHFRRRTCGNGIIGKVAADNRMGSHNTTLSDCHPGHDENAFAQPCVGSDCDGGRMIWPVDGRNSRGRILFRTLIIAVAAVGNIYVARH